MEDYLTPALLRYVLSAAEDHLYVSVNCKIFNNSTFKHTATSHYIAFFFSILNVYSL